MNDDLDLFLQDFGKAVSAGAVTGLGILDMPGQVIADGIVINTDYRLTVRTDQFGGLLYGDGVVVDGVSYAVRELLPVDDGSFCEVTLTRVALGNGVFAPDVFVEGVFAA